MRPDRSVQKKKRIYECSGNTSAINTKKGRLTRRRWAQSGRGRRSKGEGKKQRDAVKENLTAASLTDLSFLHRCRPMTAWGHSQSAAASGTRGERTNSQTMALRFRRLSPLASGALHLLLLVRLVLPSHTESEFWHTTLSLYRDNINEASSKWNATHAF